MLRRITSTAAAFLMLIAMTRVAERLDADYVSAVFYGFFVIELLLFMVGVVGTERGYFGPRRHPVNRMFIAFSWVGVIGALVTMVVQGPGGGNPLWIAVISGASMFTGGMAAAVLAVSGSPWRDLLYSRRFNGDRPDADTESDAVPLRDDPVHGVPREQAGRRKSDTGA
jgi:hypothetical protein